MPRTPSSYTPLREPDASEPTSLAASAVFSLTRFILFQTNEKRKISLMKKPLLTIQYRALAQLSSPTRALRKNDPALARMIASIEHYGFRIPVLITAEGEIVDGDLRLKAARKLGFTEVPVIVCDDWTPEQVRGFRLLANRSASWAQWDLDAVAEELAELARLNFDLSLTGFDSGEIDQLLTTRWDPATLDS